MPRRKLTHFDDAGAARMVDVGAKPETARTAIASGSIAMARATAAAVRAGRIGKGDVLGVARLAGIGAAKRTVDLIPLCHPLPINRVEVQLATDEALPGVRVRANVAVTGRTGVEMEALTAVSVALLTVYDMLKAIDRDMVITDVRLTHKSGGRTGDWDAPPPV